MNTLHLFLAATLLASGLPSQAAQGDRLQLGIHEPESQLGDASGAPQVVSVQWIEGDLRVRLTQAAPCGDYIPVNPVWEKAGSTVVLRYEWHPMSESNAQSALCMKHVQAWVFRVPDLSYTVLISDSVPVFVAANGAVKLKSH